MAAILYRNAFSKLKSRLTKQAYVVCFGLKADGVNAFLKKYLADFHYVNLSNKLIQARFREDPERFFGQFQQATLFDEIHLLPDFIEQYKRYAQLAQLLGKTVCVSNVRNAQTEQENTLDFLPLSASEIKQEHRFSFVLNEAMLEGSFLKGKESQFGRIVKNMLANELTHLTEVHDPKKMLLFFKNCVRQLDLPLNLSVLARLTGITVPTATYWLENLVKIGLLYLLPAHPKSYGKRVHKSPKLYLIDTGLACHFLGINSEEQLYFSPHYKALLHNWYVMEFVKKNALAKQQKTLAYWKESNGHEIKLLVQNRTSVDVFEFTSRQDYVPELRKELDYFDHISDGEVLTKSIVYGGFKNRLGQAVDLRSWHRITAND